MVFDVVLTVTIHNPQTLWDLARAHLATLESVYLTEAPPVELIGTRERPLVGNCAQLLLDRSEHLEGAGAIEQSSNDGPEDDRGEVEP